MHKIDIATRKALRLHGSGPDKAADLPAKGLDVEFVASVGLEATRRSCHWCVSLIDGIHGPNSEHLDHATPQFVLSRTVQPHGLSPAVAYHVRPKRDSEIVRRFADTFAFPVFTRRLAASLA